MDTIRNVQQDEIQRVCTQMRGACRNVEVLANQLEFVSRYLPQVVRSEVQHTLATIEGLELVRMNPYDDKSLRRWVFMDRMPLGIYQSAPIAGVDAYCFLHNWSIPDDGPCPCCKALDGAKDTPQS